MKRILFVDDETSFLDGVRRMLLSERERWQMKFLTSGEDALSACAEQPFDVVVSDLRMPGMDGIELLGKIRELYPETARILISGNSEFTLPSRAVSVAYRILVKPCHEPELRQALERVFSLQDVLGDASLREIIGTLGELPSLSATYTALTDALNDPESSMRTITQIIQKDAAMCAKILQVVNSGFFGLALQSIGLEHAVSYLGLDTIRTLALHSETFRVFVPDKRIPGQFLREMQQEAQNAAIVVSSLALQRKVREAALVAALLHEIGTLVLASSMPQKFLAVLEMMKTTGCSRVHAEETILGTTHAEIGAYLLGLWGINNAVIEAIAYHHHPMRVKHIEWDCTYAFYLANLLAHHIKDHPEDVKGEELSEEERDSLKSMGMLPEFASYRSHAAEMLKEQGVLV